LSEGIRGWHKPDSKKRRRSPLSSKESHRGTKIAGEPRGGYSWPGADLRPVGIKKIRGTGKKKRVSGTWSKTTRGRQHKENASDETPCRRHRMEITSFTEKAVFSSKIWKYSGELSIYRREGRHGGGGLDNRKKSVIRRLPELMRWEVRSQPNRARVKESALGGEWNAWRGGCCR